jgi:hypothetical protein
MKTKILLLLILVLGSCVSSRPSQRQFRKFYDTCPTYSSVQHWRYVDKTLNPQKCNHVRLF